MTDLFTELYNRTANDAEKARLAKFHRAATECREIQYFDVKLITDRREDFKKRVQLSIEEYRGWNAKYHLERDMLARVLNFEEGALILAKIWAAHNAYKAVNSRMLQMRAQYLRSIQRG